MDEEQARKDAHQLREQQREQERQAKDARRAQVAQMAADKTYAVPAISAIMCSIDDEIATAQRSLERERRITATGGVIDLGARNAIASDIVDARDELAGWSRALKRFGASRMACKDVAGIVACRNAPEKCDDASRGPEAVWDQEQGTLWASDRPRSNR